MKHSRRLGSCARIIVLLALISACGQSAPPRPPRPVISGGSAASAGASPGTAPAAAASATPTPTSAPWPLVLPVPSAQPGHQTGRRPAASSAVFRAEMTDLWAGVVSGRPELAMPSFFPLVAYEQVKAIADPAADWQHRLVAEFRADIKAAHNLLGSKARHATLVRVMVPEPEADWINPGVCSNGVGYWHVAGARVVYQAGGAEKSFGIATLISWRGRWYVVHLGGEVRTVAGGMVDDPSAGSGIAGPPGGC